MIMMNDSLFMPHPNWPTKHLWGPESTRYVFKWL